MPKAKTKAILVAVTDDGDRYPITTNGHSSISIGELIDINLLKPSATNPRRRFPQASISELAGSLAEQGVIEPLIARVTAAENKAGESIYEIVCGERRYRAAQYVLAAVAGSNWAAAKDKLRRLPCIVRPLTDEQVLDIQIHENLHREDVHPMDEAFGYKFLQDKLACDVKELALRVGKTESYVLNRLKLNQLIKEAQDDIDAGHLPLLYALELAKYAPDAQKLIYQELYHNPYSWDKKSKPDKTRVNQFKGLQQWIATNILRLLAKAPFDKKATNLRKDGLACINCPERTGAAISLFDGEQIGKKDACLDPVCYAAKSSAHVQITRQKLADAAGIELKNVPVVKSWNFMSGKDYIGRDDAAFLTGKNQSSKKTCKSSVSAVDVESGEFGKIVTVCLRTSKCKTHWPAEKVRSSNGKVVSKDSDEHRESELEEKRERREEIWNSKIAEATRYRVFKAAAEKFSETFMLTDVGSDFGVQLIARLWRMSVMGDSNNVHNIVKRLVGEWDETGKKKNEGIYIQDGASGIDFIKSLAPVIQYRVLFLLTHCHKGTINYNNSWQSQKSVRNLAVEFKVNYDFIDAEVRVEFSPKKFADLHKLHLEKIGARETSAAPLLYAKKWKGDDLDDDTDDDFDIDDFIPEEAYETDE